MEDKGAVAAGADDTATFAKVTSGGRGGGGHTTMLAGSAATSPPTKSREAGTPLLVRHHAHGRQHTRHHAHRQSARSGWLAETAQPKKQAVLPAEDRNRPAIFTRPSQLKIFRLVDHHTHLRGERTTTRFVLRDAVIPPPGLLLQATGHRLVRLVWCSMAAATTAHSSSIILTDDVPSACDTLVLLVGCHTLLKSLIAASKVLRSGWKLAQSLS
jgi:hypothetical protein